MAFDVRLLYKTIKRSQETCVIQFVHGHIEICTSTSVVSTSLLIGSSRYAVFFIKIGCTTIASLSLTTKSFGTIATYEEITTIDSGYRLSLTKKLTCLHCKVLHWPAYTKSKLSDTHRLRNKCITAGSFTRNSFSTGHPHDRLRPDWLLLLATCGQQGRQTHHEKCVSK